MNFQEAVKVMESGKAVSMEGWNYPIGSFLKILPIPLFPVVNDFYISVKGQLGFQPFFVGYTALNAVWNLESE